MAEKIKRNWKNTNKGYLVLCVLLSVLSVVTLFSVGQYGGLSYGGVFGNMRPAYTQIFASLLGICAAVILSLIDFRRLMKLWPLHVAICWGLVLLTFIPGIGYEPGLTGSRSWIAMPFGMSFQPTEIAKISFYLTLAMHLDHAHGKLGKLSVLVPVLLHILAPVLLVHLQGDDGTAMVFLAIGIVMLFVAGINRWVVITITGFIMMAVPLLWKFVLGNYQKERILGLFFPERYADSTMYQQIRARVAIGSGQWFGKGLFSGSQYYVPRSENDFIFSYYAEACGFIGTMLLLGLLAGVLYKTLFVAAKASTRAGAYVCTGIFATLLFQIVINVGMNLLLLPVVGLTLPFMSAGGTSVLMLYISVGLVLSVSRHTKRDEERGRLCKNG